MKMRPVVGQDCEKWGTFQKHWYCFHEMHTKPTMWSECKCITRHRSDALFVLHPSQNEPLPAPMVKSSFARKVYASDITSKPFRIDPQTRAQYRSKENGAFADRGFRSMNIMFTPEQTQTMRAHLARAVRVRNEVAYHDGRLGYKISENELKR